MSLDASVNPFATLPPIGPTVTKFKKILFWGVKQIAQGVLYQQFEAGFPINLTPVTAADPAPDEWRRFVCHFDNLASTDPADDQYCTFDVVKWAGDHVDSVWDSTSYSFVATGIRGIFDGIKANISPQQSLIEIKAYRMAFNDVDFAVVDPDHPLDPPKYPPFADSGDPVYRMPTLVTGTGLAGTATQVTSAVIERTASRRNWGRFYTPSLAAATMGTNGRLVTSVVDNLVTQTDTYYTTLAGGNYIPVVPTTYVSGARVRTLQSVSGVASNDVPDIQRRRKLKSALYTKALP